MKQISLIIPHLLSIDSEQNDKTSGAQINQILRDIHKHMSATNVMYEVIIVTNSVERIDLHDVEIFPSCVPVSVYYKKHLKTLGKLSITGILLSRYDYIGIIGGVNKFSSKIIKKITSDKKTSHEVIASVQSVYSRFFPYFLRMRINQQNAALFFPRNVWKIIHFEPHADNTFFIEILRRSHEAGFPFKKYHVVSSQEDKILISREFVYRLLIAIRDVWLLQIKKIPPFYIAPQNERTMMNAGVFFKKQHYITHTTLNVYQSAIEAFNKRLALWLLGFFFVLSVLLFYNFLFFIQVFIAVLSGIYLIDIFFNLFLVLRTFRKTSEIKFTQKEFDSINEEELPFYSILCPLYKEAHILPQFINGLEKLDWPKEKLDVLILLESDDKESLDALASLPTPNYIHTIIVPDSVPKTKPKACNYGLAFVKGEYMVIYDAEDLPDPQQLKKAYVGFNKSGSKTVCLQAKLNYYNSNQNLLTRFFTAEYSLWFDITLPSLQSLNTLIPLGGTSNHFKTKDLKKLHAWDPFNVAEDADLGMRLFKLGYRTAVIDSVTLEEGNSQIKNWIRQRSRWIKGYMQTYLVHTRESYSFFRERGIHAMIFHLVIGGKLAFTLINPILWIVTILYFVLYSFIGSLIDSFYPQIVLYIAMTSLIFGNALYLFCYLIACVKTEHWSLIKYMYLIPFYWILISIAGFIALYQLIFKPFYWEKTIHGLHLNNHLAFGATVPDVTV